MNKIPNIMKKTLRGALFLACAVPLTAQVADEAADDMDDEDIYTLSPFEVSPEATDGYIATDTLGGTRVRTDLRDLATPLSAVTSQFLSDTGVTNSEGLLTYTTNTEVGGLYGNWGGMGNAQGIGDRNSLIRPDNATRVRGLDAADNTRNYFLTNIPWDSYNVDRVEIQRGPNSILFGVGSPAGIINTTTISAKMDGNSGKIEHTYGKFGSNRISGDYNIEIIDDVLAVRVAGLWDHAKYRQRPGFENDERIFATATWQKQILPEEWAGKTQLRVSAEKAEVESNNPRWLPPVDNISLWFEDHEGDGVDDLIGWGQTLRDMHIFNQTGGGGIPRNPSAVTDPLFLPGALQLDSNDLNNGGLGFFYTNGANDPFFVSKQAIGTTAGGLGRNELTYTNDDGEQQSYDPPRYEIVVDGSIENLPYASPMRVSGFNQYARQLNEYDEVVNGLAPEDRRFPGAPKNYYKDKTLTDPTIFDFYNQLIDGDNKREHKEWDTLNLSLSQTFFNDRVGIEAVYDKQSYAEWRTGIALSNPYISVDPNMSLQNVWSQYEAIPNPNYDPDVNDGESEYLIVSDSLHFPGFTPTAEQPYPNANAGAAFLSGGFSSNNRYEVDRTGWRVTAYAEFRGSDIFDENSSIAHIIGTHTLTGLLSNDETIIQETSWRPSAVEYQWAADHANAQTGVDQSARGITPIIYLSGPLLGMDSASGLNLGPINTLFNPGGTYNVDYFDGSEWVPSTDPTDPTYIDPNGDWTQILGQPGVQVDSPFNYPGRQWDSVNILNETDDFDDLVTGYTVTETVVDSEGIVYQGKFLDGLIVPTYGWRRDYLKTYTYTGEKASTDVVATDKDGPRVLQAPGGVEGQNRSWGLVAHAPSSWFDGLSWLSGVSAYYNEGANQKVQTRYNYDGQPLENAKADSTDYGIVVSMFDEKLSIKLGKYETKVKNGNLPGGSNVLGENVWYIWQLEAWMASNALIGLYGYNGLAPDSRNWEWNYALVDSGWDSAYADPESEAYRTHPSTIHHLESIDAVITGMEQQFFDNYDINMDVPALQAAYAHWKATGDMDQVVAVVDASGYNPAGGGAAGLGSLTDGNINGIRPNGTIDSTSEGYELEINYRPVPNWNIQINAAKTDAYREDVGLPMQEFIAEQYQKLQGDAGDLRMWWGGDVSMRSVYENNVISALNFVKESVGTQAPELRPYSFNLVTNYAFTEDFLKGWNVGGGARYQDAQILGYRLKDDVAEMNAFDPIKGEAETHFDFWVGYEKDLTEKVHWRIQANVRNVGESVGLVGISANPNDEVAASRIAEGMTWSISNTFSF